MGKEFDVKARMREIKADPKRYIGVLERAIKRRDEVIANLQRILDGIVKNRDTGGKDGMKSEYDFSKGVRGKYAARYAKGTRERTEAVERVKLARNAGLSRDEIVRELKRIGWKKTKHGWNSPNHKAAFQGITLREAASMAALSSSEDLGGY